MGALIKKTCSFPGKLIYRTSYQGEDCSPREEWMGVYFQGEKIGYVKTSVEKKNDNYRIKEEIFLQLLMMGSCKRVNFITDSRVNEDFSLKSFDFSLRSGLINFRATGEIVENKLLIRVINNDEIIEEVIKFLGVPYLSSGIPPLIARGGLKIGRKYSLPIFDPSSFTLKNFTAVVEAKEKITINNKMMDSCRIKNSFEGIAYYSWINNRGERLKENGHLGLSLIKESRDTALEENWERESLVDLIELSKITPNTRIANTDKLKSLTVRLNNINFNNFAINKQRQRLENDVLEIKQEDIRQVKSFSIPYRGDKHQCFLSSTPLIQSSSSKLTMKADSIIEDERDALKSVRLILKWVFENIKKKPILSIPSALAILKLGEGDCNEHAVLFTSLCRAVGIPTKICLGITYSEGSFYYHAWSEVYLNPWISIDPTLNQFPADPTHIKFVEGNLASQQKMVNIMGKLGIEVLEYQSH